MTLAEFRRLVLDQFIEVRRVNRWACGVVKGFPLRGISVQFFDGSPGVYINARDVTAGLVRRPRGAS